MPGVPGQRSGVPPKRSDQRRRRNKPAEGEPEITKAEGAAEVPVPELNPDWHPLATYLFRAAEDSGQAQFYEPSDWAYLAIVCENLSRHLKPMILLDADGAVVLDRIGQPMTRTVPMPGAALSAYLRAAQSLLLTEGDRRRMRVELERPKPGEQQAREAGVPVLDDFRSRFTG